MRLYPDGRTVWDLLQVRLTMPADENGSRLVSIPEWQARGIRFEKAENAEWLDPPDIRAKAQERVKLSLGGYGRVDVLIEGEDGLFSIIEAKAKNWDVMAERRVPPNILRHAWQVMKYVDPFWEQELDVCPGIIHPQTPKSRARKLQIEAALAEQSIQVVWFIERERP